MVTKSQNRISGPILDRIDIHLEVPRVPIAKLALLNSGEPPVVIRIRVYHRITKRAHTVLEFVIVVASC
jgi:magnesium chelatase family protein